MHMTAETTSTLAKKTTVGVTYARTPGAVRVAIICPLSDTTTNMRPVSAAAAPPMTT